MAQHIAEKLRVTAALLGAISRKDLAAAFRRANPETAFDLGRADKWLQGRSQPRQLSVYEDWSKVLDLDRPGAWIAQCEVEAFAEAVCEHHGVDREELERRMGSHISPSRLVDQGIDATMSGAYACYSKALSPYYRGQLIRSTVSIKMDRRSRSMTATYKEALPTGSFLMTGPITLAKRGLYIHLRESGGDAQFFLSLFLPSPPGSVLAGYMCGTTIIGPEPLPSAVRILMIRLPKSTNLPDDWGGYLLSSGSIVEDLGRLGIALDSESHPLDRQLWQFLNEDGNNGPCQITESSFRTIVNVFDRHWLRHHA
ncbi:hypothetical protein EET67_22245 [Pseudaminobacter arsenicus]|uniref:Uncharacterized protein n=1 Tax=Borborobacter arsenicus TaxID=1851146 RepID=A0A432V0A5_9HYPH|nr:hypothetical protein [Pseudaminobacter arsenicus]RUM95609.1 hypothetical protein EET67_22245 [Pseudaminobacter arsenicus]